nr:DUF2690 domain-containing protein [Curtobacterium pusillum]
MTVAAFVIGAAASGVVTNVAVGGSTNAAGAAVAPSTSTTSTTNGSKITVANGTDPADTACVDDAKVVASEARSHDIQLQIIYSAACHAAWSRITRYDDRSSGNTVTTSIYRQIAPKAGDRQTTTEADAQSAYTTLIVRPSAETRLCADGAITIDGATIDVGDPLCL